MVRIDPAVGLEILKNQAKSHEKHTGFLPSKILGIPKGDPVFCFCMIGGKTKDHLGFQDSGASVALASSSVVKGGEFNRVIINNDEVTLNLAGGANMKTNGAAIVAIPLLDGNAQAVQVTLVNQVEFGSLSCQYKSGHLTNWSR